jgi:L-threonylcarbamoyladenylate synthase
LAERLDPTPAAIARAAEALRRGELVGFPTETVYGLGAVATNDRAVAAIFDAKGRPRFNPLIVHVRDRTSARPLVHWTALAERLAARFWPGPLTLVLTRRNDAPLSSLVGAGGPTVGLRAPAHPVAQALLGAARLPVAAPSANPAGRVSPTTAQHVLDALGERIRFVLDGGPCAIGLESTVIDVTALPPRLLRPGGLTREALEAEVGELADGHDEGALRSPGRLASHYAPAHPVRLGVLDPEPDEGLLAFGPKPPAGAGLTMNLSPAGDLVEAAANLFSMLHALDRAPIRRIAVVPIPELGLGRAINDRLRRAAAPAAHA